MKSRSAGIAVLVALALGLAAWLTWSWLDAPALPPSAPTDPGSSAPSVESAALARDAAAAPERRIDANERTAADRSGNATWIVRGELMHGSVAPLPHTPFVARLFAGARTDGDPLLEATLTSDAQGAFAWRLPPPPGTVTMRFAASSGDTQVLSGARTIAAGEPAPQDVVVFAFLKDCEVTGTVTDAARRPIAGAWVKSGHRDPPELCDGAGRFVLRTSATYGDAVVRAGAPGHVVATQSTKVRGSGARLVVNFELQAATRLQGRVVDEETQPIAGVQVATNETYAAAVRTGADGRFALDVDPARESHVVFAEHAEYLSDQRRVPREQLAAACDFVLRRGARIRGRVLGTGDRPIADAVVLHGESYTSRPRAVTHADGSFELGNVPAGRGTLTVSARGHAQRQEPVTVPEDRAQVLDVVVRLAPGHFVAGRVVDPNGTGLHRVRITPRDDGNRDAGDDVYTARDGSFRIEDLPEGKVTLDCFGTNLARRVVSGVAVDRADHRIVVERSPRLAGRVVDDATGLPLAKFTLRFVTPDPRTGKPQGGGYGVEWSRGLVFENCDGYWHTDGEGLAAECVYAIEASADGYGPRIAPRLEPAVDMAPDAVVLRLRAAAHVTGRVVDQASGTPVRGAQLALFDDTRPLEGRDPFEPSSFATRTADDGTFELRGMPAGDVRLVVRHADWPLTIDGPFATAPGATTTRVVAVPPGAVLTGTVLDAHAQPVAGATVVRGGIEVAGVRIAHASAATDAAGRFRFGGLSTGRYAVHASSVLADGSALVWSRHVEVQVGQSSDVPLEPLGGGAVRVELSGDDVAGAVHVAVHPLAYDATKPLFRCQATGPTFVVRGLPEGELVVSVTRAEDNSLASGSTRVTVTAGEPATAKLSLHTHRR